MPRSPIVTGALYLAASAFLFASMGVFIRLASHTVSNELIVFARNLTGLLILLPWIMLGTGQTWRTGVFKQHLWRALTGITAMYGFFYAIAKLPLSTAMVFTYSSPIFIPIVASIFLKEAMTARAWTAAIIGFIGVLLVCRPHDGALSYVAIIGVCSSFLAATAFVTVRALGKSEPAARIVFYFALISTLISALPLIWAGRALNIHELGLLIIVGVLATVSQLCMTRAYALAPANRIGPITYLAIVFGGAYAWWLWQEVPSAWTFVGSSLIIFAGLWGIRQRRVAT
jgi:drug/metabolite transporter (DMT)-like permease